MNGSSTGGLAFFRRVLSSGTSPQISAPSRRLYNFRVPIRFCDDLGFILAEDFYRYNPAKLPNPIEWVNKREIGLMLLSRVSESFAFGRPMGRSFVVS